MAEPSVTVITATTGHTRLRRCLESVQSQTYSNLQHLVVVDGPEWFERADATIASVEGANVEVLRLPHATGKDLWYGHRIYGAMPLIVLTDYVCWLDDDNWFDEDHVAALVEAVDGAGAAWGFSLRKLVDAEGALVALDQCESLGSLHPTWILATDHLVDTSCYMVRRDVAINTAWAWNRISRPADGPGPDRLLCRVLMDHFPDGQWNGRYSLNYTLGNTAESVHPDFFHQGNEAMRQRYPDGLPWERRMPRTDRNPT
jgi:glycosyltransferase involved in cell wall biosynthesis